MIPHKKKFISEGYVFEGGHSVGPQLSVFGLRNLALRAFRSSLLKKAEQGIVENNLLLFLVQ